MAGLVGLPPLDDVLGGSNRRRVGHVCKKVPVLAMCSSASATHLRRATGSTNARANPPAWTAALEDNHESLSHAVLPASIAEGSVGPTKGRCAPSR